MDVTLFVKNAQELAPAPVPQKPGSLDHATANNLADRIL